jgi:shikimate dehydrogenase
VTRIVGIFGDPIAHTLSPAMHNAAFASLGLDWVYVPARVRANDLEEALRGIRAMGWAGINVTLPHKERVARFLDRLSPEARLTGSVNTILCGPRGLTGHNTDGRGFLAALGEERRFRPRGARAVILGAGGSARAIAVALVRGGAREIAILNRTPRRAEALARDLSAAFPRARIEHGPLTPDVAGEAFEDADLLVNATAVGMGLTAHRGLPLARLPRRAIVSDIVYRPARTPLLEQAARRGLRTQGGLGMLLHQGAEAFSLWTGRPAPLAIMRRALRRALSRAGPG